MGFLKPFEHDLFAVAPAAPGRSGEMPNNVCAGCSRTAT